MLIQQCAEPPQLNAVVRRLSGGLVASSVAELYAFRVFQAGSLPEERRDEIDEEREKFRIVRTVLEQGGHFKGVNRKVQLKPTK